jgi:putative membrane protein
MSLMMVPMLLFWGAIIFGFVWLVRGLARDGSAPHERAAGRESPVEIFERRFAEGEITEEDFRARRAVLVSGGTARADAARPFRPQVQRHIQAPTATRSSSVASTP